MISASLLALLSAALLPAVRADDAAVGTGASGTAGGPPGVSNPPQDPPASGSLEAGATAPKKKHKRKKRKKKPETPNGTQGTDSGGSSGASAPASPPSGG